MNTKKQTKTKRTDCQADHRQRPEDLHADAGRPRQHERVQARRLQDHAVRRGEDGDGPPHKAQGGAPPPALARPAAGDGGGVVGEVGQVQAGGVSFDVGAHRGEEEEAEKTDERPDPQAVDGRGVRE